MGSSEFARQKKFYSFITEARDRDNRAEIIPAPRAQPSLLSQFTCCARKGRLHPLAAARGDLPMPSTNRVTILREHRDTIVSVQRHDRSGTWMPNHGKLEACSIGQFHGF